MDKKLEATIGLRVLGYGFRVVSRQTKNGQGHADVN